MIVSNGSQNNFDYEAVLNVKVFIKCKSISKEVGFIKNFLEDSSISKKFLSSKIFPTAANKTLTLQSYLLNIYIIIVGEILESKKEDKYLKELPEKIAKDEYLKKFFNNLNVKDELQPYYLLTLSAFYHYLEKEYTMLMVSLLKVHA